MALRETYGPLDAEEDNRLALFSIHQKGSLDEYIRDFTQLSLPVLDLDEHSRALMFVRGLADNLRIDAMREHPRTFPGSVARRTHGATKFYDGHWERPIPGKELLLSVKCQNGNS